MPLYSQPEKWNFLNNGELSEMSLSLDQVMRRAAIIRRLPCAAVLASVSFKPRSQPCKVGVAPFSRLQKVFKVK